MIRWRTWTAIAIPAALIAATLFSSSSAASASVSGPTQPVSSGYTADPTPDIRNPERGLFVSTDALASIATDGDHFLEIAAKTGTMVHLNVDLSAYYQSQDDEVTPDTTLPQELLDTYALAFQKFRDAGMKAIVRFSYTPKGTTVCGEGVNPGQGPPRPNALPDANIDTILKHISELAGVLNQNADVIASFEAGFLGEFGEWHCSVNSTNGVPVDGNPIVTADKLKVVDAERAEWPTRTIALRYPADISELSQISTLDRIGSHQDCYASSVDDKGTWSRDPGVMKQQIQMIASLGESSAVNATVCTSYPDRVNCTTALTADQFGLAEMPTMHFSFFAADSSQDWLDPYPAGGCWNAILAGLGYRFTLEHAELPATLTPGGAAHLSVTLRNNGFASMFNPRPVDVVLRAGSTTAVIPLGIDARSWASGETVIDRDITIPADLAPGDYSLALWLPDASASLADSAAFSVRFANVGTWQSATGENTLGTATVPADASKPVELAASGLELTVPLTAGVVLVLFGGLAIGYRRRSRHS
jgi:hypothetical protein